MVMKLKERNLMPFRRLRTTVVWIARSTLMMEEEGFLLNEIEGIL